MTDIVRPASRVVTRAYKFTKTNRRAIYGVTDYPPIGEWSEMRDPVLCAEGWHVPSRLSLTKWIAAELWLVEVRGLSEGDPEKTCHEEIRFINKVDSWNLYSIVEFAEYCAARTAYADARADAYAYADAAARADAAAARAGAGAARAAARAYADARADAYAAQSDWITDRLQLDWSQS